MIVGLIQLVGVFALLLVLGRVIVPLCARWRGILSYSMEKLFYGDRFTVRDRKNVLLVTAHPDDESMFFVPSLLSLNPPTEVNLFVLCLSKGLEEGETRVLELEAAAKRLSIKFAVVYGHSATAPLIAGVPQFQDGFDQMWSKENIAAVVDSFATRWNIHTIITFDDQGVSLHPNHIALNAGLTYYLNNIRQGDSINIWTLHTETKTFKYSSWVGPLGRLLLGSFVTEEKPHIDFLNPNVGLVWSAMNEHASQMVWFRMLFLMFSSYAYSNRLFLMPKPATTATKTKKLS